jgi:hypothetical protein
MQSLKHIAHVLLIAYIVIGFLCSLYDSLMMHGLTGILAGQQDHRDVSAIFHNLLWPLRFIR